MASRKPSPPSPSGPDRTTPKRQRDGDRRRRGADNARELQQANETLRRLGEQEDPEDETEWSAGPLAEGSRQ
jgi:hypothetical protein